jgi:hypothetical protein
MFMPPETARAASALKNATSAVSASGIGREVRVVVMCEGSFRSSEVDGEQRTPQKAHGQQESDRFYCFGEESEPVDSFRLGVKDRHTGRGHQRIAGDQSGEDRRCREERDLGRLPRQDDGEDGEEDRRRYEAQPGPRAFLEVLPDESAVDARADRAGEDDDVGSQLGERHLTITVP